MESNDQNGDEAMSKFRYYIIDISNGTVLGTDNTEAAEEWAELDPDGFVCDTDSGEWLVAEDDGIKRVLVEPVK
jgi:hypothetical protein